MSVPSSRRRVLSVTGAAVVGTLGGCLGTTENNDIDLTVSNASDRPIDYEVTIEEFEESGRLDAGGSDQYENELGQPGSTTQFAVVASFTLDDAEDETGESDNGTDGNGSNEGDLQTQRFEATVDVASDVLELSVTYTGGEMVVNPVVENESS